MNSTKYSCLKHGVFLFLVLALATPAGWALAQSPWEDVGFSAATPRPDPDLVIVREKAYGAEGVDLTPYGIGTGPVDFVQSIYFRFFTDTEAGSYDSFIARATFPPDVTILGIIIDGEELGGSVDDGVATETDAIFGIASNPDDYSEQFRGFEQLGGEGTSEFVALADGDNAIVFGLNIEEGIDDFRVIIDYGSSFIPDLAFNVQSYRLGQLGGAVPERGFRVGDDMNAIVFGSGDFGEAGSLMEIPLTSTTNPFTQESLPFNPFANIFILRDQGGTEPTLVDGFDVVLALPAPDLHTYSTEPMWPAAGTTDGLDGNLYSVSSNFGLAISSPGLSGTVEMDLFGAPPEPNNIPLEGTCVDITNSVSANEMYLLRDQDAGATYVDRLELTGYTFTDHIPIPGSDVTEPVAIADFPNGMLFVADADGGFATINTSSQDVMTGSATLPEGTWKDATRRGDLVYVLREVPGGAHTIDIFTPEIGGGGAVSTFGYVDVPSPDAPAAITEGPYTWLYVVSAAPNQPATVTVVDPSTPTVLHQYDFLHFPGSNVSVTNLGPVASAVPGHGSLPSATRLMTAAAPNPFNPQVAISYLLERDSLVRVEIYDIQGRLVRTLHNGPQSVGEQSVTWDGRDRQGRNMPSGTYLYRVNTGTAAGMGKVTLAK